MKEDKITQSVYKQVLDRLEHRKRLAEEIRVIVDSGNVQIEPLLQEQDRAGGPCVKPDRVGTHHFVCNNTYCLDSTFACPASTNFECNASDRDYGSCDRATDNFQCNQTASPTFSCEEGGKTADYFDCRTFACGQEGGKSESFDCDSVADFVCGEDKYNCVENFDCTAGHGFFCFDNHECGDQFTCSGGTVKGCTEDGKVQAVSCVKGPNVDGYNPREGGTGGDGNSAPGDFLCGYSGGNADEFDCTTDFDCKAESDFSCLDTSDFTCNDFKCHSKSPFMCYTGVTCRYSEAFDCSKKDGVTYNCAHTIASYAECKSDSEKECKSDYRCPSENECAAPKFECSIESNMYKCVDSVPAYIPPDTFGA